MCTNYRTNSLPIFCYDDGVFPDVIKWGQQSVIISRQLSAAWWEQTSHKDIKPEDSQRRAIGNVWVFTLSTHTADSNGDMLCRD